MKRNYFLVVLGLFVVLNHGTSQEHWGAGQDDDIIVTSSSSHQERGARQVASGTNTIDGSGLDARYMETTRFLQQATLGVPREVIQEVADMSYEDWIDDQLQAPMTPMLDQLNETWEEVVDWFIMNGGDSTDIYGPYWKDFNYAWWTANSTSEDYLRHRMALALSEIFVISINTDLGNRGYGLASYYDVLYKNALGDYRDMLGEVTLHPCMGFYLSHLNNPKAIPEENIRPDENYAREVMQLFTIGLYELNQDGSRKQDNQGRDIPTYGQKEITEFAKIFTGLGVSEIMENMYIDSAVFDLGIYLADLTKPMKMYEEWHQTGTKELLNGLVLPDGQDGMSDINDALDNLFEHDNVGPFISKLLIQRLVKSNPTPGYISRVAGVFNSDENGQRGNLGAVAKAILMDEEARTCDAIQDVSSSRLKEPMVRYAQIARTLDKTQVYGRYWNTNYGFWDQTGQSPLWAPSVFNFFLPDYQPQGEITAQGYVAPEYQLHNTKLSVGFLNQANSWFVYNNLMSGWEQGNPAVSVNVDHYKQFADSPEVLMNELDKDFTNGELKDETREIIKEAISKLIYSDYRDDRVRLALYLLILSPDYAVMR